MRNRTVVILIAAFVVTRVANVSLAFTPLHLGGAYGDLQKYETWAAAIIEDPATAYADVPIEYPPGVLPFIAAARAMPLGGTQYGHHFIWVMVLLDIAAFAGVMALSARWGSPLGPLVWIAGGMLLGPIMYLRLDLIPATATIWALQRASVGRWGGAGGWLGFGALAKVYPAFLLLLALPVAPRPKRLLAGALVVAALLLAPVVAAGSGDDLVRDVIGYHGDRGIQVESTWGFLLLAATRFGYGMYPNYQFGANEAVSALSPVLESIGLAASVASLLAGWWIVRRCVERDDVASLGAAMFGTLALLMFFGTVFSPQFAVWLVALAAAGLAHPLTRRLRPSLLAVLLIAPLTHVVFSFVIGDVLAPFYEGGTEAGAPFGLALLGVRNAVVLGAGAATLIALATSARRP